MVSASMRGVRRKFECPTYTGLVVGGGTLSQVIQLGFQESIYRRCYVCTEDVTVVQFLYANVSGIEVACPGSRTITGGVENYDGTFSQITFNGGSTSVALAGGAYIWSDPIKVKWRKDSFVYVRTWTTTATVANGVLFGATYNKANIGEWSDYGVVGTIPDITLGGSPAVQHNQTFGPITAIGLTNRRGILMIGDSRLRGSNSVGFSPSYNQDGEVAPLFDDLHMPYVNCGLGGEAAYLWTNGTSVHTIRTMLATYCTDLIFDWGINDFNGGGATATGFASNQFTVKSGLVFKTPSGLPFTTSGCTVSPYTTSSNNWIDYAGQTVFSVSGNTNRNNYNTLLRANTVQGIDFTIDISAITEYQTNSGFWLTNGTPNWYVRTDGLHPTTVACQAIRDAYTSVPSRYNR